MSYWAALFEGHTPVNVFVSIVRRTMRGRTWLENRFSFPRRGFSCKIWPAVDTRHSRLCRITYQKCHRNRDQNIDRSTCNQPQLIQETVSDYGKAHMVERKHTYRLGLTTAYFPSAADCERGSRAQGVSDLTPQRDLNDTINTRLESTPQCPGGLGNGKLS